MRRQQLSHTLQPTALVNEAFIKLFQGAEPQLADRGSEQVKLLDLHRALQSLACENPSLAQVVEMHYFGGMTAEQAAVASARSVHVVRYDLRLAQAWLRRELARSP
jgi:DNA-directed RNA polymerase specialized sigma24 family protein